MHGIGRERDDPGLTVGGEPAPNLTAGFESIHFGHLQIHQHEMIVSRFQSRQRFESVADGICAIAEAFKKPQRDFLVHRVVLREEHIERNFRRETWTENAGGV